MAEPWMLDIERWSEVGHCQMAPTPALLAELQGVEFTTLANPPGDEGYLLMEWSGWHSGTSGRGGAIGYPNADGGVESRIDLDSRKIVLSGLIVARSYPSLYQMMERLQSLLTSPRWDWLTVHEDILGLSRRIRVCRIREVQVTPITTTEAEYTLELESAMAPRVGMEAQQVVLSPGGEGEAVNIGNYPARLLATLRPPLSDVTITVADQTWRWPGSVPRAINIDFSRRTANDQDGKHYRRQASGKWPSMPPGTNEIRVGGTGDGTVTLRWLDSWT